MNINSILEKYSTEGILFNIVKDEEITIVTNRKAFTLDMEGNTIAEKEIASSCEIDETVTELLEKLKKEDE